MSRGPLSDSSPAAGVEAVREALGVFRRMGDVVELRALGTPQGTASGYFDDLDRCAAAAVGWSGKAEGVYFTPNRVSTDLLARAANRVKGYAKHTTNDGDILGRQWFLTDFDPERAAGISSTDAEHEAALRRAYEVRDWLHRQGWRSLIVGDSGNGGHVVAPIALPNDAESTRLVQRCLEALALQFGDDAVSVDLKTFNPARIWKLYGTLAAKGDDMPDRPHRVARLLEVPDRLDAVPRELLERLAAMAPTPAAANGSRGDYGAFDLARWIEGSGLPVAMSGPWNGGRKWVVSPCPWDPNHTNRAAYIVQHASGAVAAGCHHNGCVGKDWRALRDLVEPGWGRATGLRIQVSKNGTAATDAPPAPSGELPAAMAVLPFMTSRQIQDEVADKIDWAILGLLAYGAITELVGKLKASGKTTCALCGARQAMDEGHFLGLAANIRGVVYLTEQPTTSFRAALDRAGLLGRDNVLVVSWHAVRQMAWPDVARLAAAEAKRRGYVLIVDTLPQFAGLAGDSENSSGAALEAMRPLQEAAADGVAVLVIRHERKGGGEVGDSGRGSSAFSGAVDIVLSLKRPEGNGRPTVRVLESLSRFEETPDELVIELVDGGYVVLGTAHDVKAQEARRLVLDAMATSEGDALTSDQACDALKPSKIGRTTIQEALKEHVESGAIVKAGAGKRGDPWRYWRPGEKVPAATTGVAAERNQEVEEAGRCVRCSEPLAPGNPILCAAHEAAMMAGLSNEEDGDDLLPF